MTLYDICYVYPQKPVSFRYVARMNIRLFRDAGLTVKEYSEEDFRSKKLSFTDCKVVFIHPLIYNIDYVDRHTYSSARVWGFDVGESIPFGGLQKVVARLNDSLIEGVIVPTRWSKFVWIQAGFEKTVIVFRHYLTREWHPFRTHTPTDGIVRWMVDCKRREGWRAILYQLPHSGYRKGAPEMLEALEFLVRWGIVPKKTKLVVKKVEIDDRFLGVFYTYWTFLVGHRLDTQNYIALIDNVDICVVPSRCGGFELNALECIMRGTPTIAPTTTCFSEYSHLITVHVTSQPHFISYSDVWDGVCYRVDPFDLALKIRMVLEDYNYYRDIAERRKWEAWYEFGWEKGVEEATKLYARIST